MTDTLYLVRHGITAEQEQHRYCGHADPPLAPAGVAQMRQLGARLGPQLAAVTTTVSSDRRRALESAQWLMGRPPQLVLPELREIDFGRWDGLRFDETGCADAELLRPADFQFPGGESARMMCARVARVLPVLRNRGPGPVAVVAHGGSLAALAQLLLETPWERFWSGMLPHGGWARLENRNGAWRRLSDAP